LRQAQIPCPLAEKVAADSKEHLQIRRFFRCRMTEKVHQK
jgi:hypothetical protein